MQNYINPRNITTDSGFDSSYDSGGWDNTSDYSSYDSGEWDYSHDYLSNTSSNISSYSLFVELLVLILIILMVQKPKKRLPQELTKDIINFSTSQKDEKNSLVKYLKNLDKDKFLKERYNDFVKVQIAWMNFDYKALRELLTDELYNQYEMQLDTLKIKNEKNVMTDFEFVSATIKNVFRDKNNIYVKVIMSVSFFDYISKDNSIVRGSNKKKLLMTYELTYSSTLKNDFNTSCPSCGAPIPDNASVKCEYCNCIISKTTSKWVLKNKKIISQK